MKRIKLSKNNKILKLFFLVLFLTLFCILLVFVYKKPKTKIENNQNFETLFNQITEELKKINPNITVPNFSPPNGVWWITDDDIDLYISTSLSLEMKINAASKSDEYYRFFDQINTTISSNLLKNGFKINDQNSSKNKNDDRLYDYIQAYESNNSICIANSPILEGSSWFYFQCFDRKQIEPTKELQLPFLKLLNANNKVDKDTDFVITSLKTTNNEAKANINFRRTGFMAFFYKDNNGWHIISEGQDSPMCDELSKNKIPVDHWPDCYLDQQGNIKKGSFKIN